MPTGIQLSSGVVVGAPKALDAKYGPYASVTLALADLSSAIRYEGLTVGIVNGSAIDEYWFQGGVADSNFVIKRQVLSFASVSDFPNSGTSGIIYIARDSNRIYRWGNTAYTELSPTENANWNSTGGPSQILNKPTIPSVPVLANEQTLGDGNPPYENLIRLGQHSIYRFIVSLPIERGVSFGSGQAGDLAQVVFSASSNASSTLTVVRSDGFGNAVPMAILHPGTSCFFYNPTGVNTAWVPLQTQVDWNIGSGPNSIRNKPLTFPPETHSHTASQITSLPVELVVACSDETSNLTIGAGKVTFRAPYAFTLTGVRASVNTAPTGSTLIVDINVGGNSILSTKLSIDASEKTSTTAATAAVISDSSIANDAELTIDIDQIGSTIAGKGLKIVLIGTRA